MLIIDDRNQIPLSEIVITYARSSGPGGQNVNKVNSKAVLCWNVLANSSLTPGVKRRFLERYSAKISKNGEVVLASDSSRDRLSNVRDCYDKLRTMVQRVAVPPKPRKKTRPTKASKERRLKDKKERSETKKARRLVDN